MGTVEISYFDWDKPNVPKNAFTVITTWANTIEEFEEKCKKMLESYGWALLGVERANPAPADYEYSEEISDMLERTRVNPNAIIYGKFYSYPVM